VVDSNDNPYVAIMDNTFSHWNIRLARSNDGGSSFLPSEAIESYASRQIIPSLGIDINDNLYVAWTDNRTGVGQTRFSMSEDGGATFRPSIAVDPTGTLQNRACLDVDFQVGIPHVVWADMRQGRLYVYHSMSLDNGVSFQPSLPVFPFPVD
jgi:hypothetical protein